MLNKVFIEGCGSGSYHTMWKEYFGWEITDYVREANLIQFTGGEDVDPFLYQEYAHPTNGYNSRRDQVCVDLFDYACDNRIPMVGICRGGQFLNVANGGKMYQDCDGHGIWDTHEAIIQESGLRVQVTSTHHQIMRPERERGIVIMEAEKLGTYKQYMSSYGGARILMDDPDGADVEAVFYPDTLSLCYQPHPEYCDPSSDCVATYAMFIRNYLEMKVETGYPSGVQE